ncbi:MAG: hypothetical protein WC757_02175 [Candidatus Paceibacterota bacterium]|jgi:DNA-directed RNA polymerase subunit RPC12/RpoP
MVNSKKTRTSKICFLITPIGAEGSPVRRRVDQWKEMIYNPALGDEYKIIRADDIPSPGVITEQIVQHIIDADLVIIDYTDLNPNVMYEAAIRHLAQKPCIQIHESKTSLPFDIHNLRSIPYDRDNLQYPGRLIEAIKNCLIEFAKPSYKQPQIVKERFDFNKIISDPNEFVKILKQQIVFAKNSTNPQEKEDSIVTIKAPYDEIGYINRKKIVCPKCGTTKYEDRFSMNAGGYISWGQVHYKCNNCGTEFELVS